MRYHAVVSNSIAESVEGPFDTPQEAWQRHVETVNRLWDVIPDDSGALLEAHTSLHNLDQSQPGEFITPVVGAVSDRTVTWSVRETP